MWLESFHAPKSLCGFRLELREEGREEEHPVEEGGSVLADWPQWGHTVLPAPAAPPGQGGPLALCFSLGSFIFYTFSKP